MITDYEVVCGHDIWDLKARVKEMLPEGWQPFNELQVATPVIDEQVMVKEKVQAGQEEG